MSLMEIIKNEKKQMNRVRFIMNYIIIPILFCLFFGGLAVCGILMTLDEKKYETVVISIFISIGILMICSLASLPFIRKKEVSIELNKKDYNTSSVEDKNEYELKTSDEKNIILNNKGLLFNKQFYDYDKFDIEINAAKGLNLKILVSFLMKGNEIEEALNSYHIELSKELIYAINKFKIKIENREVLEYILNNKEKAFEQIYKYGYLKIN